MNCTSRANPPTAKIGPPTARRSFGETLRDTLHESRPRRAEDEIYEHRHLVDRAQSVAKLCAMKAPARKDPEKDPVVYPGIASTETWLSRRVHRLLRADCAAPRRPFPLRIKAIVLDLDGTIMPSYRMLIAAQFMDAHLARQSPGDPGFIRHFLARHGFQSLLHRAALARGTALEYARERGLEVTPSALHIMSRLQEESYCLYDGVRELIDEARDNGAFVGIYTNTPFDCALHRLILSRLDLRSIDALWATTPADRRSASLLSSKDADLIIPCHSGKPGDTPLRDLQALAGIGPDEILFVGDSLSDLEAVHRDKTKPAAIFCFQEQGARDICARTTGINARLRPTHASLGADAVNSRVEGYGIGGDIIRLRDGFADLLEMIGEGRICLDAPARTPMVRQNRLAPGRIDIHRRAGQAGRFARPVVASFPQFAAVA